MAFAPFGPGQLPSPVFTPYTPANVSPAEETSIAPTAPAFGSPVATPPFVASPASPVPTFNRPPMSEPHQGAPNFLSAALPILAAALAGGRDPRAVGEGLAAFQRGRQLKLAEQEHQQDRTSREQKEAAAFYSRMIDQAQAIDDPIDFRHYQDAIAPMAKLYGVDPYTALTFSNTKLHAQESARVASAVQKILDNGDPGSEERVRTGDFSVHLSNGRTISGKDALGMIDTVTDREGNLVVKKKAVAPVTLAQGAKLVNPETGATVAEGNKAPQRPLILGEGARAVDPVTGQTVATGAPKRTGPTPEAVAERKRLVDAVIANPELYDRLTAKDVADIAPDLAAAGFSGFGKTMNESAITKIAESKSAIASLRDLRDTLKENEQYIGPIAGFQALNPYSDARKAQAKIDLVKQRVGKALEGGVLRKEDEDKYKKILATLNDTPTTAISKVDSIITTLERDLDTFVETQRSAGRRTPGGGAAPKNAKDPLGIR